MLACFRDELEPSRFGPDKVKLDFNVETVKFWVRQSETES